MNKLKLLLVMSSIGFSAATFAADSVESTQLIGKWCYFEHDYYGAEPESVNIEFLANSTYSYVKGSWDFSGTWTLDGDTLVFSNESVGSQTVLTATKDLIELEGEYGIMRLKPNFCR